MMNSHTKEQILRLIKDIYDIEFLQELELKIKDQMHSSIKEIEKIKAYRVDRYTFSIDEVTVNKITPKNGNVKWDSGISTYYSNPFGHTNLFENKEDAESAMKLLIKERLEHRKEEEKQTEREISILKSKLENLK